MGTWQPAARPSVTSSSSGYDRPRCSGGSMTRSCGGPARLERPARRDALPPAGRVPALAVASATRDGLISVYTARSTRKKNRYSSTSRKIFNKLRRSSGTAANVTARSTGLEVHVGVAEADLVAVAQDVLVDAHTVDLGAVGRAEVDEQEARLVRADLGVVAADVGIGQHDVALGPAADADGV